jgi:hypothetical protein
MSSPPPSHPTLDHETYEVQELLGHKKISGVDFFLVHWKGYDRQTDHTWEPIENLYGCLDLIEEFNTGKSSSLIDSDSDSSSDSSSDSDAEPKSRRRFIRKPPPKFQGTRQPPILPNSRHQMKPAEFPLTLEICDQWFTQNIFSDLPSQRVPQISRILQMKTCQPGVFLECLFENGEQLWLTQQEAMTKAPQLVQRFLSTEG